MASKKSSTVELKSWKEHTCAGCGGTFRYRIERSRFAQGDTDWEAEAKARAEASAAIHNEVDMQPCPACGMYQPDMVGDSQATLHGLLLVLVVLALGVLAVLVLAAWTPQHVAAWVTFGICALIAFGHFRLAVKNPNADLEANRKKAEGAVGANKLTLVEPGSKGPPPSSYPQRLGFLQWSALVLLGLGVMALASSEALRLAAGWPLNRGCVPMVAGPGDDVDIYFPDEIKSIKGYWNGKPTVTVTNAKELGLASAALPATSKDSHWGKVMMGRGMRPRNEQLWATASLPESEGLEGKTLQLQIALDVAYPAKTGLFGYEDVRQGFSHSTEVGLAWALAGLMYQVAWWGGLLIGAGLIVLAELVLYRSAKRRKRSALASRVVPITDDAPAQASPPAHAGA
jgi:hypothetical protein